ATSATASSPATTAPIRTPAGWTPTPTNPSTRTPTAPSTSVRPTPPRRRRPSAPPWTVRSGCRRGTRWSSSPRPCAANRAPGHAGRPVVRLTQFRADRATRLTRSADLPRLGCMTNTDDTPTTSRPADEATSAAADAHRTVRGIIARGKGQPVEMTDIVIPAPGANDVIVDIQACGVCHTDLAYRDG